MTLQPHIFVNNASANSSPVKSSSPNDLPRQRTILLVEDEPFVREATCGILKSAGFEVLPAKDAKDAMKIYQECQSRIDLVMTDMVLPGRSGEQLGQDLRKLSPEVVVLVTSGYNNPEYEAEAPETHSYFLPKPYSKRMLVDKIETILGALPLAQATQAG
jgi:DNA-binding NtrC family response regulator